MITLDPKFPQVFVNVPLKFEPGQQKDVFGKKNNKTLGSTIEHKRYSKFSEKVVKDYNNHLSQPLGKFLLSLKHCGDQFYDEFLNEYGNLEYTRFYIKDEQFFNLKGVYAIMVANKLVYVGRCLDSFQKRFNQGYGKINPKNCYIDGQSTNCRINAKITQSKSDVELWIHQMNDDDLIKELETQLIDSLSPPWNIKSPK